MNTPADRDATMRDIANRVSVLADGTPLDVTVGGLLTFICAQCDHAKNPEFNRYTAGKLRQVADFLDPKATP